MKYYSTRDTKRTHGITSSLAIINGIAPDGGLYMPESIPHLSSEALEELLPMSYAQRAASILSMYLTDYEPAVLKDIAEKSYSDNFFGYPAPVERIRDGLYSLELWHGPTCAFKDMALQIMPRLLSHALKINGTKHGTLILVPTSGDTGKAALEGYKDIEGMRIMVFYPEQGVSAVQKLQMATQEGDNVSVVAIKGNFDDAQTGVKHIFADPAVREELNKSGWKLSSANSINWGRLVPQIVYYVSAYLDMVRDSVLKMGDEIDVTVPTGNFGNILAAYVASQMGLPIGRLVCASNKNNILTDFINTGKYDRNRPFYTTMSPSMDILISSNLERLLFVLAGAERTAEYMTQLSNFGRYEAQAQVRSLIRQSFSASYCDEEETASTIKEIFEKDGYLCDTHTAVAVHSALRHMKDKPMLVCSTASAYKFAADVLGGLKSEKYGGDELDAPALLEAYTGVPVPTPLKGLASRPVRFKQTVETRDMADTVLSFCKK
ncbi:MAG: threonine synthase [Eubacteriales bacterium]